MFVFQDKSQIDSFQLNQNSKRNYIINLGSTSDHLKMLYACHVNPQAMALH